VPPYASWGRRIGALVLDWTASVLVVIGIIGTDRYLDESASGFWVLGVYAAQASLLTAGVGGSFGQVLLGIRVRRTDGRPLDLLRSLLRHAMICLAVPPLIFDSKTGRGLHDLATDSAAYRRVAAATE
jgi:uncharacterized RDD family membrane protein YckC